MQIPVDRPSGTVRFRSEGVQGVGFWPGDTDPPTGTVIDVELEIPSPLEWNDTVWALEDRHLVPQAGVGSNIIEGVIEDLDASGTATVRTPTGLVQVSTVGTPPSLPVGCRCVIHPAHIALYPTNC